MNEQDLAQVVEAASTLPSAQESYLEGDFVMNLLETVLDYQTNTKAVVRALEYYREQCWVEIRTLGDLETVMEQFPDDKEGNTALAQHLWGYDMWTRAHQLRDLAVFFRRIGVTDQRALSDWARRSTFKRDFEGRVRGLGIAVYQWLVMRQGVETVKPDVHVHRFVAAAIGRGVSDAEAIELVTAAARQMGLKPYELDWRIWEASRGGGLPYPK